MDHFANQLKLEIIRQQNLLNTAKRKLATSPKGSLSIRKRHRKNSHYWNIDHTNKKGKFRKQININENKQLILQLTEKAIQKRILARSQNNLYHLNLLSTKYGSTAPDYLYDSLGQQYQEVLLARKQTLIQSMMTTPYPKAPYDPRYHTHETDYGEFVRSKSEQILANTLFAYGIPFHYEEEFLYSIGDIGRVYPDFTIMLPKGKRIIWEHLGRLDDPDYCQRFAEKINIYQQNGYVIGENLIITMDDNKGNFSSSLILHAIEQHILPKLGDIRVDKETIIKGKRPGK